MDNSKFLKRVIVALLLVNIATLSFMWSAHFRNGRPERGHRGTFTFLTEELKLDDNQQEQYVQLRNQHREAVEELQEKSKELHDSLFGLLSTSAVDFTIANQIASAIADNQKQLELFTFSHFQKVRAICNPQQQKRFDEVISDALRMMAPKPPRK